MSLLTPLCRLSVSATSRQWSPPVDCSSHSWTCTGVRPLSDLHLLPVHPTLPPLSYSALQLIPYSILLISTIPAHPTPQRDGRPYSTAVRRVRSTQEGTPHYRCFWRTSTLFSSLLITPKALPLRQYISITALSSVSLFASIYLKCVSDQTTSRKIPLSTFVILSLSLLSLSSSLSLFSPSLALLSRCLRVQLGTRRPLPPNRESCSHPLRGTARHDAVQCSAVQCSTVQYSAVQYSTVQCSAVQCTVLYSVVQCAV